MSADEIHSVFSSGGTCTREKVVVPAVGCRELFIGRELLRVGGENNKTTFKCCQRGGGSTKAGGTVEQSKQNNVKADITQP